jgi:type III secretory pathway component EscV
MRVDHPAAGAGDAESAAQRRERLKKRVQLVRARGAMAFLKTIAEAEGVSVSRLKQILAR